MFSDPEGFLSPDFGASFFSVFNALRAFLPLVALYLGLLIITIRRFQFPFHKHPLLFLLGYGLIGLPTSLFLSVNSGLSLYWAGVFLSPFVVLWVALDADAPDKELKRIVNVNYSVFFFIALSILPDALRILTHRALLSSYYQLPFHLGSMTKNGAGRFAMVMFIVATVRFVASTPAKRILWGFPLAGALAILAATQSRTALLGLAVSSMFYVILKGMNWRFLFLGPFIGGVLFLSGFAWRAHGRWDQLLSLTGREYTWQRGLALIKRSPFLGWGFHSDRLMMNWEHMHNSYLHAMIHTGIIGLIFFVAAFVASWYIVIRSGFLLQVRLFAQEPQILASEAVMIVAFMTARSFFESTAAFYGVDLLLLVPAISYIVFAAGHESFGKTAAPTNETAP
jgi:O-antigen ligase